MRLFVISKVGNPIKLAGTSSYNGSANCYLRKIQIAGNVNRAKGHKFSSKTVSTEDLVKPVSSLYDNEPYERKSLPDELSDKIATLFIAHLFKYLFKDWY